MLLTLGILFAAATVFYSLIWMSVARHPFGDIGFRYSYSSDNRSLPVVTVEPHRGAEQAGLRTGDVIVAINGQALDAPTVWYRAFDLGKVGDVLELTVKRTGTAARLTHSAGYSTVAAQRPAVTLGFSACGQ